MLLRILELNGAIGLLVLVILISNMPDVTAWVMRITVCGPYLLRTNPVFLRGR